jgi:DNA-binding transcriptional LysR family regulator
MVIQAAERGMGVALGRSALVVDSLRRGTLVRPFQGEVPSGFAYWLVCPVTALDVPRIRVFRDWLKQEAAQSALPTGASA